MYLLPRRRMPKQLYIPLPCPQARRQLIHRQIGCDSVCADLSEADIVKIVEKTAGYSGSDMKNLIQEACQGPVREAVMAHGAMGVLPMSVVCLVRRSGSMGIWLHTLPTGATLAVPCGEH
jgi:SpoVK/Ycf46/Vps4 family AAA+-type ATPase